MKFIDLGLCNPLLKALDKQGFQKATEIQVKTIPFVIKWKDILATAQTWSWKTLAFGLPLIHKMYEQRKEKWDTSWKSKRILQLLIIVPTRELAIQIWENLSSFCTNTNFKLTTIFWWVNQFHQVKALQKWVDILVATPWRLEDLIGQWYIKLSNIKYLVLDEADIMLDMWFLDDIKKVIKRIPENRQTLLFSATMPQRIKVLSEEILNNPEFISVWEVSSTTENIDQYVYKVSSSNRRKLLQYLVKQKEYKSIIVFVRTKDETEFILEYIKTAWISADNIHRNRSQNARQRVLKSLKDWNIKVLVATDIASRWLDVSWLSLVINYNLPKESETYVHRIWRTGRAWKKWISISFCTKTEEDKLKEIEKLINKKINIKEDIDYKNEVISKTKILWYTDFDENWKEKYKKKTRKSTWKKRYYKKKK